jgi:predicted GIY-YIG superfamily endonuclease
MIKKTTLYTLVFEADEPVVFYVGHTNNTDRRWREHITNAFNENHAEYDTYKYRWIRGMKEVGIECSMVVLHEIEDDDDTEYEWILKFARANERKDIKFYDGYPLTNMKAGDLLEEIIDLLYVNTKQDIGTYRKAKQHTITYTKNNGQTETGFTVKGRAIIAELQRQADASRAERHRQTIKRITREAKREIDLQDPGREAKLKKQTLDLLYADLLRGAVEWQEYNQMMYDVHGGYEAWTETPPQLLPRKPKP